MSATVQTGVATSTNRTGRKPLLWALGGWLACLCSMALADESGSPKGVNPKDVVTKVDVIVRRDSFEGGVTLDSLTAKYDVGLNERWALAVEVLKELRRLKSPVESP